MKRKNILKHNKKGFTFVECIVAVALFAIIGTLGFSMFHNSSRYMSNAKREEIKQNQALLASQSDDFKWKEGEPDDTNYVGKYKIYTPDILQTKTIVSGTGKETKSYYANMTYKTDYGSVTLMIPLKLAPDYEGNQPGVDYKRYMVLSDGYDDHKVLVGRYIYIYDQGKSTIMGAVDTEYQDKKPKNK